MRNNAFILGALLLWSILAQGQEMISSGKYVDGKGRAIRYNVLKTNLLGYALGHYSIGYERKLTKRTSVLLTAIPVATGLRLDALNQLGDNDVQSRLRIRGFGIQPEVRWYLSKHGGPRGFYAGLYMPYYRYNNSFIISSELQTQINGQPLNVPIEGETLLKTRYFGGGISWGSQFVFGERITLELYMNVSGGVLTLKDADLILRGTTAGTPSPLGVSAPSDENFFITLTPDNNPDNKVGFVPAGTPYYVHYREELKPIQELEEATDTDIPTTIPFAMPRVGFTLGYCFGK